MAKKKSHSHPAANGAAPAAVDAATKETDASMRSISLDRTETLKTLNSILVKETKNRREQVSQLRSELDRLVGDADVLSLIEREVGRLVVSSGLSEIRAADLEWAAAVLGALEAERLAAGEVKRRMEEVALERAEMESSMARASAERDSAVANLSERKREFELKELAVKREADRLKQLLEQRGDELSVIEVQKASLDLSLKDAEGALRAANDQIGFVEVQKKELMSALELAFSEQEKYRNDAAAITVALHATEDKLVDLEALVADLQKQKEATALDLQETADKLAARTRQFEARIREIENKNCQLEEENASLNSQCQRMKAEIEELKLVAAQKDCLDAELESSRAALKNANMELDCVSKTIDETMKSLEGAISERDANRAQLVEKTKEEDIIKGELEMLRLQLSSLIKEKEMLHSDFESLETESRIELATLRSKLESIEQEKAAVEELKDKQVADIAELSIELRRLLSRESDHQVHLANVTELNNRLQVDVQNSQRALQLQIEGVHNLKLQVEELTKNKENTSLELQKVKAEVDDLVILSDSKGTQIDALAADKAKLERELADTRLKLADMEGQARSVKVNFDKALSLLRSTSELVSAAEEGEGGVVLAGTAAAEEQVPDADVQVFDNDLKAIRAAFERGAAKKEQLSQEINLLQEAAENDKSGIWTWLCPAASTLVAAASLAYAATAKGR